MNDIYAEQLVKRRMGKKELAIKVLVFVLLILSLCSAFIFSLGVVSAAIMIVLAAFVLQRQDIEYEYLYYNDELDIDIIYGKARRKRIFSTNINEIEILAPIESIEVKPYRNVKTYNYSSLSRTSRFYAMIIVRNGQKIKIIFEPKDAIVEGMYLRAPGKVIRD